MPLFICQRCKTIENSALGQYWTSKEKLCSECAFGKWHGRFEKEKFDPEKWEVERGDFIKKKNRKSI